MTEKLVIPKTGKRTEIYESITPQIEAMMAGERDLIANLANLVAAVREAFGFFWVGFYLVKEGELILGPFQGPVACTRIAFNRGVCGHCYQTQKTVIVPNVDLFPGHIACSLSSKSEIVVPVWNQKKELVAVLDVDSNQLNDFSEVDQAGLEKIVSLLSSKF
jgi:L-methionine (R)-S-oxide reductase